MHSINGQFVQVWPGEAELGQRAVIYSILLDVQVSSSFGTDRGEEYKV